MREGLTRRIPATTDLGLKTGKLPEPISQSAFYALRLRPLLALGTGEMKTETVYSGRKRSASLCNSRPDPQ
jgi:hypothetical protein